MAPGTRSWLLVATILGTVWSCRAQSTCSGNCRSTLINHSHLEGTIFATYVNVGHMVRTSTSFSCRKRHSWAADTDTALPKCRRMFWEIFWFSGSPESCSSWLPSWHHMQCFPVLLSRQRLFFVLTQFCALGGEQIECCEMCQVSPPTFQPLVFMTNFKVVPGMPHSLQNVFVRLVSSWTPSKPSQFSKQHCGDRKKRPCDSPKGRFLAMGMG
jgi:hypothetical protein